MKKLLSGRQPASELSAPKLEEFFKSCNVSRVLDYVSERTPFESIEGSELGDKKLCLICKTPRSGSTYLCSLLTDNNIADTWDHFRWAQGDIERDIEAYDAKSFEDYFLGKVNEKSGADGLFVTTISFEQFVPLYFSGIFDRYLKDATFVMLTRRDVLSQAISLYIAHQSGYFHTSVSSPDNKAKIQDVPYDAQKILDQTNMILNMQNDWEKVFVAEGISPLRINYEEISGDPATSLERILAHAGVTGHGPFSFQTKVKRVSTERNSLMKDQFLRDMTARVV